MQTIYLHHKSSIDMSGKLKIYFRVFVFIAITSLLFNCGKNNETQSSETAVSSQIDSTRISERDISKIKFTEYALSDITSDKTENWQAFNDLANHIESLRKGDLSFFKDDKTILESFISDLKNQVPESLKNSGVLVRLKVLETSFLKLEGHAILSTAKKEDILSAISDVLVANSNLILQINKQFEKESQQIIKPS